MIPSIIDFQPEDLYRAHEKLVRSLLPQAWWSRMIPREITAWAHLFAVGGMAVYSPDLQSELMGKCYVDETVGTFVNIDGKCYFVGDNGYKPWSYMFPAESRWQASRLCSLLLRTCTGPVDGKANNWHGRISTLGEVVQAHASTSHAFRALLSLGRLYDPSVNKDLRYTPCISERSELYSEYKL